MLPDSFVSLFGAYFHGDDLEDDGRDAHRARVVAACLQLSARGIAPGGLLSALHRILAAWSPAEINRLSQASSVDWLASTEAEDELRFILEAFVAELSSVAR